MARSGRRMTPPIFLGVLASLAALAVLAGVVVGAMMVPLVGLAGMATRDATETFDSLQVPALSQLPSRSEILDANGSLIAYYYPNYIYRIPVSYQQISPPMRQAIVAIEDTRFYSTGALDIHGTLRAIAVDLVGGQVQGASTLAQQYVKNALLLTATSNAQRQADVADDAARKIIELRIAASIEHELTQNQLLAAYLNVAYFENEAYGVEVAAQRYFSTTAAQLTLPQAAMLAGLVQNPAYYDPLTNPAAALARRNIVLTRMSQLHYVTQAAAAAAEKTPLGLRPSAVSMQQGCYSASAQPAAWFCDYVLAELRTNPAYRQAWQQLNSIGGLRIYTTMDEQDQQAAQNAVSYMVPPPPSAYNPGQNAAAEVLIQPGTGWIRAIAVDRPYGTSSTQNEDSIDYAVDSAQNGGLGVQTGSSSKLFTLITALKQDIPFGFHLSVVSPSTIGPYYNCRGQNTGMFNVSNAEGAGKGTYTLYTATTQSINVFFAELEQRVGLCNVVQTAVSMGVHRATGQSLLTAVGKPGSPGYQPAADDVPSFTLGVVNVSPLTMAGAYATVASGGIYCTPLAIRQITGGNGKPLPVQSPDCHRVISALDAEAATYILRGVLTSGTAKGDGVTRNGVYLPQAGKTGTANSFDFAAFGGYTPLLAGYVSMFNPTDPIANPMTGSSSCYRSSGGAMDCPGSVYGANAGQIWQMTFEHADLGSGIADFTPVPAGSGLFREGPGTQAPKSGKR
jgi:membrane peptidoglycan carboxypeptidase